MLCKIKNLKHVSKKDELANKLKSEVSSQRRLKEKEDGKKLKPSKIFVTSTLKKEEDRRHPSTFKKDKREPARSLSNDSNSTSERSVKSTDKITLRDGYRSSVLSDEGKHKNCQKYEVKSLVKESVVVKKSADKLKQGSKVRDTTDGTESCSSELVHKKTDDSHVTSSTSQDEVSKEKRSDQLLDPVRIDFRDGNGSPQAEFSQLDTPDISSFMRMKRRRQMLQQDEAINNRRTHENQTQMVKTKKKKNLYSLLLKNEFLNLNIVIAKIGLNYFSYIQPRCTCSSRQSSIYWTHSTSLCDRFEM